MTIVMTVAASLAGCGGTGLMDGAGDLAVGPDLAFGGDMAMAAGPDMAQQATPCLPAGGANRAQYVWNAVIVPMQRSDYGFDLNGDGRIDNQLGNIEGALAGQMLPVQDDATQAVTSGQSLTLVDEHADDLANDDCAAADLEAATAMASPDFSGAGHFTVNAAAQAAHLAGPIAGGKFSSEPSPAYATTPVAVTLDLPLLGAVTTISVVGVHVQYMRGPDGKLTGGQLNGAIKNADVQAKLIPNIASALTAKIMADTNAGGLTATDMQILSIFDNGGKADASCVAGTCKNPDGTCAVKGDNKIDICEISTSGLIQNVLAPDVQMFDASGNYHPNPDNTMKDSLSIGLGFTAVPATF